MPNTPGRHGRAALAALAAAAFAAGGLTACEESAPSAAGSGTQEDGTEQDGGRGTGPRTEFGGDAGQLEVGTDVRPGLYVSTGNRYCFWRRDNGGDVPVASDAPVGTSYVRIDESDITFTTEGCGDWRAVPEHPEGEPATSFSGDAGVLMVGVDIAPGVYVSADNGGDCFFQTMTDASHEWTTLDEPGVVSDDGTGRIDATREGTFLRTMGCAEWVLQ
ncbi:hypothetical protein [Streptomyces sp. YIM 98790]|uniref:hypothetical protein n=1 Tax=Streptomyces sp. YIM 98790 TaxID=2689077 RepID=UPI00140E62E3|nr:hypothetical protein [Streptomyces sp. YIM 98790]